MIILGPTRLERRLELQGDLTTADVAALVGRLEGLLGRRGTGEQAAGLASWHLREDGREHASLNVGPGSRGTRVFLQLDQRDRAVGLYLSGLLVGVSLALLVAFAAFQPETAAHYGLLLVAGGLAGHLLGTALWRGAARRWEGHMDRVLAPLVEQGGGLVAAPARPVSAASATDTLPAGS